MSYRIEYQYATLRFEHPDGRERYIVAVEGGYNNLYEHNSSRRVRDWGVGMLGTEHQVIAQAVRFGAGCERGELRPGNRDCTPQAYIRRIRKQLAAMPDPYATWQPNVVCSNASPLLQQAREMGLEITPERDDIWGRPRSRIVISNEQRHLVFDFLDRHPSLGRAPWSLASVGGLSPS